MVSEFFFQNQPNFDSMTGLEIIIVP